MEQRYASVIIGCGYVGQRLLRRWQDGNKPAALGVSRQLRTGFDHWLAIDLDHDDLTTLASHCDGAVIYYFAAPSSDSERDDRSQRFIDALQASSASPSSVVLISTTGVYGDCAGQWVDETAPLKPEAARSKRRVDAEIRWQGYAEGADVALSVLRVAGIYGPGKLPLARLEKDQPLLKVADSPYSNRVHVDDLLDTAEAIAGQHTVVNVADGSPSTMTEYFHTLADVTGLPRLVEAGRQELEQHWSHGLRSYMSESRRVDNQRMRELLGGELRYPELQHGLESCL